MKKKALIIGGGAVALVAVIVAIILIFTGGENAYRSIKVFEIDGSCKVERDGDTLDAFKNMALSSGDTFTVGDGSFARLKLDDDKYVYLEANTKINLTATGTANDSKTMVYIERGSMLTEVKKKLSATSSYDIVTPNTTMSIRGTKTLTEVYEDILGAIKTSAAVVEGQVVFSTIQKDSKGNPVIADVDLGVGQGLKVTTDAENLLKTEDVKSIADNGKTADGQTVESTTHEELGTVLETPDFSKEFLTNIVAVLARSQEEDIEEGFTAEEATEEELNSAIQVLNDVIEGNVELPAAVEEYIISQAQSYYDEPIANDASVRDDNNGSGSGQQTVENSTGSISEETGDIPAGDDTSGTDETDDNLVNDNPEDDTSDAENGGTETDGTENNAQRDGGDDSSDETDENENKAGEGESEEERIAREEKERLEKEEAKRLEKEEQDKKDKEEKERLEKEEKEKQEKEEREKTEKEAAEREAQEAAEREEAERLAREEAEREAAEREQNANTSDSQDPNTSDIHGSSSSSSAAESESVTVTWSGTSHSYQASSSDEAQAKPYKYGTVSLNFKSGSTTLSGDAVPTSFNPGDPLPGTSQSPYDVEVDSTHASYYEFEGWYTTETSANNQTSSQRIETVPTSSSTDGYSLWAAFKPKDYTITLVNNFPEIGTLKIPSGVSGDGLTYALGQNGSVTVTGLHYGDSYCLPEVERLAKKRYSNMEAYKDYPYISVPDGSDAEQVQNSDLLFFSRHNDINAADIILNGTLGSAEVIINPIMLSPESVLENTSPENMPERSLVPVLGNDTFYMYFGTFVTLTINDGKLTIPDHQAEPIGVVLESEVPTVVKTRKGTTAQYDEYWKGEKQYNFGTNNQYYTFTTIYFGLPLHLPNFSLPDDMSEYYSDIFVLNYGKFMVNNEGMYLYSSTDFSHYTALFGGTGSMRPFPVYNTNNTTEVSYIGYNIEITASEYAILDMSGIDNYYFAEYTNNNLKDLGNGRYKTALISFKDDGSGFTPYSGITPYTSFGSSAVYDADGVGYSVTEFANMKKGKRMVALPDDVLNPWFMHGETRTGDFNTLLTGFNTGFSEYYPYLSRPGYRLAGYDYTYTDTENKTVTAKRCLNVNDEYSFYFFINEAGGNLNKAVGTNIYVFDLDNVASPVTIKPFFAPITPFTVDTNGTVSPSSDGKNAVLRFSNIDLGFVDKINIGYEIVDDRPYDPGNAHSLEIFYTDDSSLLKKTMLLGALYYDSETNSFVHKIVSYENSNQHEITKRSYQVSEGKVTIPIVDLAYFEDATIPENLRVLAINDSDYVINYENGSTFNRFVNDPGNDLSGRHIHFTYYTTESYFSQEIDSEEDMSFATIRAYVPIKSKVYMAEYGYPQYICTGCWFDPDNYYKQNQVFKLQSILEDIGLYNAGQKAWIVDLTRNPEGFEYTDREGNPYDISGISADHSVEAENIYIRPTGNSSTLSKQKMLLSIKCQGDSVPLNLYITATSYME